MIRVSITKNNRYDKIHKYNFMMQPIHKVSYDSIYLDISQLTKAYLDITLGNEKDMEKLLERLKQEKNNEETGKCLKYGTR